MQKRIRRKLSTRSTKSLFSFRHSIFPFHLPSEEKPDSQAANTYSTDPTAPACITYSQAPPTSGSAANAGLSPTVFSYSCGPTQTTRIYLASATNAPASASDSSQTSNRFFHLPVYAYVGIGIGGLVVLGLLWRIWRNYTRKPTPVVPIGLANYPPTSPYQCRHCLSIHLSYRTVQPGNRNGNVGRAYYVCVNANCPNVKAPIAAQHERGWVTWHDNVGVAPTNPLCSGCKRSARMDTAGERSARPGQRFWTCSTGACDYTSWRLDGKESWGEGF